MRTSFPESRGENRRMNLHDCVEFTKQFPICYLATADGDQPRVRAWNLWFADDTGFYFHTLTPKDVCQQLQKNPKVELCFTNGEPIPAAKNMRLTGVAEFLSDPALRARMLEEMPFLKPLGNGPSDPIYQLFRVAHGEAFFWTIADSMREKSIARIRF
jgi:pyridoxamine 5'-phosphate oxidase